LAAHQARTIPSHPVVGLGLACAAAESPARPKVAETTSIAAIFPSLLIIFSSFHGWSPAGAADGLPGGRSRVRLCDARSPRT
jgi:hypothetical protein